jgi:hypothetical protein
MNISMHHLDIDQYIYLIYGFCSHIGQTNLAGSTNSENVLTTGRSKEVPQFQWFI